MYSVLYNEGGYMNNDICLVFKEIFQNIEKQKNKNLQDLELTSIQASVLIYLLNESDIKNQRDIEKKFNLTNPTVNGILNRLEFKGFIKRTISQKDARNKEVHLTDKSLKLNSEMNSKAKEVEKNILNNISKDELEVFYNVVKKISENIKGGIL